jgi:hypothetical protein
MMLSGNTRGLDIRAREWEKLNSGTSIKRGCQKHFYAKQMYMDISLCQLIYRETTHANKNGDRFHGVNVVGFRHALGTTLSAQKKNEPLPWSTCSCSARIILGLRSIVAPMRAPTDINCKINIHMIPTIHCKYNMKKRTDRALEKPPLPCSLM